MEMTYVTRTNLTRELYDLYRRLSVPVGQLESALHIHRQMSTGLILELKGIKHVITELVDPLTFKPNANAARVEDERIAHSIAVYLRPYDYAETRACSSWLCWHQLWDGIKDGSIKVYAMREVKFDLEHEEYPLAI